MDSDAFRQKEPEEVLCRNYAGSLFDSDHNDFHNKLRSYALLNVHARSAIFRKNQYRIPLSDGT